MSELKIPSPSNSSEFPNAEKVGNGKASQQIEKCTLMSPPHNRQQVKVQSSIESFNTLGSLESDRWSQRGISSRVSINLVDRYQLEDDDDEDVKCFWLHKVWYNCILPGFFGIDNHRVVRKISHRHPIAKQLVSNVVNYNNIIHSFIKNSLLGEIKTLATQMYFPTGQIEADGLSVISADVWASTYLLVGIHRQLREADFHYIRSAYSSLAWDSNHVYRDTLRFHQIFNEFTELIIPLWKEIIKLAGIPEGYDYLDSSSRGDTAAGSFAQDIKCKGKLKSKMAITPPPPKLPSVRISDELTLENKLGLRIIPEIKSGMVQQPAAEKDFEEFEYGQQVEIIKELLHQPADVLSSGRDALKIIGLNLLNDGAATRANEMSCNRAMKILRETLQLLYKEVKLTPSLKLDLCESIRATSEDIHNFLTYTQWAISKISEFHSMIRLCFNFALLTFDLDLPSFEMVMVQEKMSEDIFKPTIVGGKSVDPPQDEKLRFKVISLTKMMTEAASSFASMRKQGGVDDNFAWEDFYKTDYHLVLQRLPLRLGYNLLQFWPKPDSNSFVKQQQRIVGGGTITATPNFPDAHTVQIDSRMYIPRSGNNRNQNT